MAGGLLFAQALGEHFAELAGFEGSAARWIGIGAAAAVVLAVGVFTRVRSTRP